MIDFWCETLTAGIAVQAAMLTRRGEVRVFAVRSSKWGDRLVRWLPCLRVQFFTVEMGAVDEHGRVLRYRIEAENLAAAEAAMDSLGDISRFLPTDHQAYADDWRRLLSSHLVAHFRSTFNFFCFVTNHYRINPSPSDTDEVVIALGARFLPAFLVRTIQPGIDLPCKILALRSPLNFLVFHPLPGLLLQPLVEAWRTRGRRPSRNILSAPGSGRGIVLEQWGTGSLDDYPAGGHLYWQPESGIAASRVVMYCNREDSPPDSDALALFDQHGFGWIDGRKPLQHLHRPVAETIGLLAGMLTRIPWPWSEINAWGWLHICQYLPLVQAYRQLARDLRIVVLHQHEEQFARPSALVLGIRMEEGMFFWNHWSISHFPVAREPFGMADLLIAWGDYDAAFRHSMGFRFRRLIKSGIVYTRRMNDASRREGQEWAARLTPQVRFPIVVFDSSHGPNSHQPTATLVEFLRVMITACDDHPDWGILFKGKMDSSLDLFALAGVRDVVSRLESEGRFLCLPSSLTAEIAACGASASVSYAINSAGINAALANGTPCLLWDAAHLRLHPLYFMGALDKVVFQSGNKVIEALEALQRGDHGIGDFAPYARVFDSYGDGEGNSRVAWLIGNYVAARDRGLDRDQALDLAVEEYGRNWGADKILPITETAGDTLACWKKIMDESAFEVRQQPLNIAERKR